MKKFVFPFLKILISVILISWLISAEAINFSSLPRLITSPYFYLAALFMLFHIALHNERWRVILSSQDITISKTLSLKLSLIGVFFNFALPGAVGGDLLKCYYASRHHESKKGVVIFSVFFDRLMGLFTMTLLSTISMGFSYKMISQKFEMKLLFFSTILLLILFLVSFGVLKASEIYGFYSRFQSLNKYKITSYLYKFLEVLHAYSNMKGRLGKALLFSILGQIFAIFIMFLIGQVIASTDVSPLIYAVAAPIGFVAAALPIAPAGIGVGQAVYYYLFNLYLGYKSDLGSTVITVYQLLQFLFGLVGMIYYLKWQKPHNLSTIQQITKRNTEKGNEKF